MKGERSMTADAPHSFPGSGDPRWRLVAHVLVVVVGVAAVIGALAMREPTVTCRGEVMAPGSVCEHTTMAGEFDGRVQTYEERRAASDAARPVIGAVGGLVAVFGVVLLVQNLRRGRLGDDAPDTA